VGLLVASERDRPHRRHHLVLEPAADELRDRQVLVVVGEAREGPLARQVPRLQEPGVGLLLGRLGSPHAIRARRGVYREVGVDPSVGAGGGSAHAVGVPRLLLPALCLALSHRSRMLAASTQFIPTTIITYGKAGSGGRGGVFVSLDIHARPHHVAPPNRGMRHSGARPEALAGRLCRCSYTNC
jgi:hypothetical protein